MSEPYELVGTSAAIAALRPEIDCTARCDSKTLITGESGVGKEIVARLVHTRSPRRAMPLVALNCAGVPDTLLESELFGHARGSFTGAYRDRPGLLESAHRGTVFLDEVGEMSLRMQALLLRFLESGEVQRVGGTRPEARVDVRVIAATNRDLLSAVAAGTFRQDLFYRLNVIHLRVPPLRERLEDIPLLAEHFARAYAPHYGGRILRFAPDAIERLRAHGWPGNVRELKNVVERLAVRAGGDLVTADDLPIDLRSPAAPRPAPAAAGRAAADGMYERIVGERQSFWAVVYGPFMLRDITRDDIRALVARGLEETAGSYRLLTRLFNMEEDDYKRFLNFLRKHQCHMPFQPFRCPPARLDRAAAPPAGAVRAS
jgi:transcriptional regulator with GAF, ATPase, and Fis domain